MGLFCGGLKFNFHYLGDKVGKKTNKLFSNSPRIDNILVNKYELPDKNCQPSVYTNSDCQKPNFVLSFDVLLLYVYF